MAEGLGMGHKGVEEEGGRGYKWTTQGILVAMELFCVLTGGITK